MTPTKPMHTPTPIDRYDMVVVRYKYDDDRTEPELTTDGKWVRWEDVEPALAAIASIPGDPGEALARILDCAQRLREHLLAVEDDRGLGMVDSILLNLGGGQ